MLLAAFSLAPWGLELQLDLAYVEGDVTDLYLRPPPVWTKGTAWYVSEDSVNVGTTFVVSISYLPRHITSTPNLARSRRLFPHFQPIWYFFFSFLFSFLISLIADGPHNYHPACDHKGSSHLSPVHASRVFIAMQVQHSYNSSTNG